jgi:hypothetical protein
MVRYVVDDYRDVARYGEEGLIAGRYRLSFPTGKGAHAEEGSLWTLLRELCYWAGKHAADQEDTR